MNEIERFKKRWQEIMCLCEADTPSQTILANCIDELAGCFPVLKDEAHASLEARFIQAGGKAWQDMFFANIGRLNEEEK